MLSWHKRGGEKYMSPIWIVSIIIVGIGIAIGVGMFYSAEIDVRKVEAEILSDRIVDCLFEEGFLISSVLEENFDIFRECNLNKGVFDEGNFYFSISIYDDLENKIREDVVGGFPSFGVECEIIEGGEIKGENFAECVLKKRSIIYRENQKIKKGGIEILTSSNQVGVSKV